METIDTFFNLVYKDCIELVYKDCIELFNFDEHKKEQKIYNLIDSAVRFYFDANNKHVYLKLQAITQLGYSRGGTNACLPDELIEHIKEYVFYNLYCETMRQKIMMIMMKQLELSFEINWNQYGLCGCPDCYSACWNCIVECMKKSFAKYIYLK